jgi:hypothetical protein
MKPCPKFDACNAPYCPLDPSRSRTTTQYREASCVFLREAVKPHGKVPDGLRPAVEEVARSVLAGEEGGVYLRRVLERASKWGSSRRRPLRCPS